MNTQANPLLFRYRRNDLDPVLKVLPHLLVRVNTAMCKRHLVSFFVVECCRHSTTTNQFRRRTPNHRRHPVIAKYGNTCPSNVSYCRDHVVELLVTSRPVKHDVVIEFNRHIFKGRNLHPVVLDIPAKIYQVVQRPGPVNRGQMFSAGDNINNTQLLCIFHRLCSRNDIASESWSHVLLLLNGIEINSRNMTLTHTLALCYIDRFCSMHVSH